MDETQGGEGVKESGEVGQCRVIPEVGVLC
jgi:hypothetical protein